MLDLHKYPRVCYIMYQREAIVSCDSVRSSSRTATFIHESGLSVSQINQSSVFSKFLNRNCSNNNPDIPGCTVRVQLCYVASRFLRTDVYTRKNGLTQAFCTFNNTFKMSWTLLIVSKNRAKAVVCTVYKYISICNKIKFINYER